MGLFQHKKSKMTSDDDSDNLEQRFLDENFREELRNHARLYFEKVITENGAVFKQDLDATIDVVNGDLKEHVTKQFDAAITQVNLDLKEHVTKQLDDRFVEYSKATKEAQDVALLSLNQSVETLKKQHQELGESLQSNVEGLQKTVSDQESLMSNVFHGNMERIIATKDAQDTALETLNNSAKALEEQYKQLSDMLHKNIESQEAMLINVFEKNMAQIIEHYLLGALGDQYDLKAQLPSIIQQMEANKQALVDDMKL